MKTGFFSFKERVEAFASLGSIMRDAAAGIETGPAGCFTVLTESIHYSNPWFTPENIRYALSATGNALTKEKLLKWLSGYHGIEDNREPATVGVVMAGNIPLVGFHDLLCVLITGNRLLAKLSTKDEPLMKAVVETLAAIDPSFRQNIELTTGIMKGFDMIIATGSNNTSRYFDYYFRNVPSIIRRNRNSIAIIDGTESDEELELLGDDIFTYFGLGCRNVSKLFLPEGYDPATLLNHWEKHRIICSHYKYDVNYDHNKAVMIINKEQYIDGQFVLLRKTSALSPPMAVVNYDIYSSPDEPVKAAEKAGDELQCVVGHGHLPFGTTQQPELWDYADNVDTIRFLLKKNEMR